MNRATHPKLSSFNREILNFIFRISTMACHYISENFNQFFFWIQTNINICSFEILHLIQFRDNYFYLFVFKKLKSQLYVIFHWIFYFR